jgi:hypothetical protein
MISMSTKEPAIVRKLVAFDERTSQALTLLSRDSMKSLQELVDEAVWDLLKKHNRPVTLREALTASTRSIAANDARPTRSQKSPRKKT